ncbi:MAG: uncharacterized protein KVP18_004881 [Porospora cf. gigantea A]|uniref:uncharacterized protein n=1 Tax=Porospora cf. gigantea A TaxID=2853593 RepID=UPI00355A3349|nr:MAG: hypothetical protein KVP18_004881 [Porospora cf. gigantea A]
MSEEVAQSKVVVDGSTPVTVLQVPKKVADFWHLAPAGSVLGAMEDVNGHSCLTVSPTSMALTQKIINPAAKDLINLKALGALRGKEQVRDGLVLLSESVRPVEEVSEVQFALSHEVRGYVKMSCDPSKASSLVQVLKKDASRSTVESSLREEAGGLTQSRLFKYFDADGEPMPVTKKRARGDGAVQPDDLRRSLFSIFEEDDRADAGWSLKDLTRLTGASQSAIKTALEGIADLKRGGEGRRAVYYLKAEYQGKQS